MYTLFKTLRFSVLLALVLMFTACSSPEEKAQAYHDKGMAFLEEGETEKAKIEFKNALQIKKNMNSAIYGLALAFEKEGDWQKVFNLVNQVVEQDPKHVKALIKLGGLYLASNKLDKALEISKKLDVLNPDASEILSYKAAVMLRSGDAKTALDLANQALAKDKTNTEAIVVLAAERMATSDYPKAIEILDQGVKIDSKNVGLHMMKITAYELAKQPEKAQDIYLDLIKLYPQKHDFRKALAAFYIKNNENAKAEAELRKIVELDPKKLQAKIDLLALVRATKGAQQALNELKKFVDTDSENIDLKFALAGAYQQLRQQQDAENVLKAIAENADKKSDGLKAKGLLAALYVTTGKQEEADKIVNQILAEDPRNEQALLIKANKEIQTRQYDSAIAMLRTILSDTPNSGRALLAIARAHELSGAYELADEHYFRAYQSSKLDSSYGREFAQFLLRRKQNDRAEKILTDMLELNRHDVEATKLLAQSKISRGDWVGAEELAQRIKENPATSVLGEQVMGAVFAGQKNYDESIAAFKRAYESSPSASQPLSALVRAYMMAGKKTEAVSFLQGLIKQNPNNVVARMLLAQVYDSGGERDAAVTAYEEVIKAAPKAVPAYQALVIIYNGIGQKELAYQKLEEGLKGNPDNANLLFVKAGLLESERKYNDAVMIYEGLYKRYPDSELIINNLASLLSERTDKDSLARAYEIAQKLEKFESPYTKDTVGWAAYKVGRYSEAVTALKSAVDKAPDVPIFQYHLGKAYLGMLNKLDARKSLKRALELDKSNSLPQDDINKLLAEIG